MDSRRKTSLYLFIRYLTVRNIVFLVLLLAVRRARAKNQRLVQNRKRVRYSLVERMSLQTEKMKSYLDKDDTNCKTNLRMDRNCFLKLCYLLEYRGGLQATRNMSVKEQVAIFLSIMSHHKKNRIVGYDYDRSGDTVSRCFNNVLKCLLGLYTVLLSTPVPISEDCGDYAWSCFPGCLGALDGTHVPVRVSSYDKPRFRSRKGCISQNVLAACDTNMLFTYLLCGWEGSAGDGRILKDAVTRPNGLRVPTGTYYLADCGYTNGDGFLTPYRGVRYHLKEWGEGRAAPQDHREYFNMKHCKARNVIERNFGKLKNKWSILRSHAFYPKKTQNHIILASALLLNFIRTTQQYDSDDDVPENIIDDEEDDEDEIIDVVEPSNRWTEFRETMAHQMFDRWTAARG